MIKVNSEGYYDHDKHLSENSKHQFGGSQSYSMGGIRPLNPASRKLSSIGMSLDTYEMIKKALMPDGYSTVYIDRASINGWSVIYKFDVNSWKK